MRAAAAKSLVIVLLLFGFALSDVDVSADQHCHQCEHRKCHHGISRDPGHPTKPKREKPGDVDRGECPPRRYLMSNRQRAGNPHCVAPWAECSITDKYSAWFVGGGAAYAKLPQLQHSMLSRERSRKANSLQQHGEGTWGLDYGGFFGKANIWLMYTCRRNQGGEGAYATDGEPKSVARLKSFVHHE